MSFTDKNFAILKKKKTEATLNKFPNKYGLIAHVFLHANLFFTKTFSGLIILLINNIVN